MWIVTVKLSSFSVLFLLWLWLDGCQSLTDSSLPEIFYPFGTDAGDSVVNIGRNTFAGEIEIPYTIFNQKKIYVSSFCSLTKACSLSLVLLTGVIKGRARALEEYLLTLLARGGAYKRQRGSQ